MKKLVIDPTARIPTQPQYQWQSCLEALHLFIQDRGDAFSPFTAEELEKFAQKNKLDGRSSVHHATLNELVETGFLFFEEGEGFGYRVLKKFMDMITVGNTA